jgi:hypothetical protein
LASVFLLKGSSAVIASYWQVNSQGTAEMMSRFSREINHSISYSSAFLKTIRSMQVDSKWMHPSIWAAFVMTGNHIDEVISTDSNNELKVKINGSVRHWYEKNNSLTLLSFENISDQEWGISEFEVNKISPHIATSIKNSKKYIQTNVEISEVNAFGTIAATQHGESWIFSDINKSGVFKKICTLENIARDWLIDDFFRTPTHIYSLFKRSIDDGVEFGLASISVIDCSAIVKAPLNFKTGIKGFANLRLFPLLGGKEVIFSTSTPSKSTDDGFSGAVSELGVAPICKMSTYNSYHIIGPDLKEKRIATFANMVIDNIRYSGTSNGVIGLDRNPCNNKISVRFLKDDFFNAETFSERQKAVLSSDVKSIEISELVNLNFEEVRHLWWKPGADYFFVVGMPIFPSALFENITVESVGVNAFNQWLSGLASVYSFNLSTRKWSKIATSEKCFFPQPLGYSSGDLFLCNEYSDGGDKLNSYLQSIQ